MKLKDILKKLEEFESNDERLDYLKELLKDIEDEELITQIEELINELEENLETKLEDIKITLGRRRELEIEDVKTDLETQERQITRQRINRPDINLSNINLDQENEVRYDTTQTYQSQSRPVYQAPQSFFDYQSLTQKDQINTRMVEEILIKEDILSVGEAISESKRDQLRETVERFMPNASTEERINAEKQIMYDMKLKGKELRYIPKLK